MRLACSQTDGVGRQIGQVIIYYISIISHECSEGGQGWVSGSPS